MNDGINAPAEWRVEHLGWPRIQVLVDLCRQHNLWPAQTFWLGRTGLPFAQIQQNRLIRPRLMVETSDGQLHAFHGRQLQRQAYAREHMWRFRPDELLAIFGRLQF